MGSADLKHLAMQRYVMDALSLEQICTELDIPMPTLREWAVEGSWEALRLQTVDNTSWSLDTSPRAKESPETVSEDLLVKHERMLALIFRQFEVCFRQLSADNVDIYDTKALRGRMEALRTSAETLERLIATHRQVRGIRSTQPSVTQVGGQRGVEYKIVRPEVEAEEVES